MSLSISPRLIETLIALHRESRAFCHPNGLPEEPVDVAGHVRESLEMVAADPYRRRFTEIVDALGREDRTELVALMFLGREADASPEDFPAMCEQAQRTQSPGDASYLFSKMELPRFWREGMRKLGLTKFREGRPMMRLSGASFLTKLVSFVSVGSQYRGVDDEPSGRTPWDVISIIRLQYMHKRSHRHLLTPRALDRSVLKKASGY